MSGDRLRAGSDVPVLSQPRRAVGVVGSSGPLHGGRCFRLWAALSASAVRGRCRAGERAAAASTGGDNVRRVTLPGLEPPELRKLRLLALVAVLSSETAPDDRADGSVSPLADSGRSARTGSLPSSVARAVAPPRCLCTPTSPPLRLRVTGECGAVAGLRSRPRWRCIVPTPTALCERRGDGCSCVGASRASRPPSPATAPAAGIVLAL